MNLPLAQLLDTNCPTFGLFDQVSDHIVAESPLNTSWGVFEA